MENNNQEQNVFSYNYSAKEQAEVKKIREKYTAPTEIENKMERLRKLDKSVTQAAQIVALILGVIGTLLLGFGMSLIMTELSEFFGMSKDASLIIGIIIGVLGSSIASLAYPIYNTILKSRRKKLAPEIIRLADELTK